MYLLFDIGGTKTRLAVSPDGVTLGESLQFETPHDYEGGKSLLIEKFRSLTLGVKSKAVGGGIAGPFSQTKKSLVASPNLKHWIGKPLREDLESAFDAPVFIENDAALVGLGEAIHGGGKGFSIVAFMTISTGVGGVRVVQGVIDEHTIGFEPGHQIIDADQSMCQDCEGVSLENYISGKSMEHRFHEKAYLIENKQIWDELARYLAYGLYNVCVFWSPEVIVLGGPMMVGHPAIPVQKVKDYLNILLKIYPKAPEIKLATLGDQGGLWGALEFLKQQLISK